MANSSPNAASTKRTTSWNSTSNSSTNSSNNRKVWSNKVAVAKTADPKVIKSSWGSYSKSTKSSWGSYSNSATVNVSERSNKYKPTSKTTSILKPSSIPIIHHDWYKSFSLIVEEGVWNVGINHFTSFINSATYNKGLYGEHIIFQTSTSTSPK